MCWGENHIFDPTTREFPCATITASHFLLFQYIVIVQLSLERVEHKVSKHLKVIYLRSQPEGRSHQIKAIKSRNRSVMLKPCPPKSILYRIMIIQLSNSLSRYLVLHGVSRHYGILWRPSNKRNWNCVVKVHQLGTWNISFIIALCESDWIHLSRLQFPCRWLAWQNCDFSHVTSLLPCLIE